jgi:hypothetical protein
VASQTGDARFEAAGLATGLTQPSRVACLGNDFQANPKATSPLQARFGRTGPRQHNPALSRVSQPTAFGRGKVYRRAGARRRVVRAIILAFEHDQRAPNPLPQYKTPTTRLAARNSGDRAPPEEIRRRAEVASTSALNVRVRSDAMVGCEIFWCTE